MINLYLVVTFSLAEPKVDVTFDVELHQIVITECATTEYHDFTALKAQNVNRSVELRVVNCNSA